MIRKRILTLCLAVVMVVSLASVCFAASVDFTSSSKMKFVDSNTWTYVCAATKDSAGKTASLSVNQIYDSNREASLYQKVYAFMIALQTFFLIQCASIARLLQMLKVPF